MDSLTTLLLVALATYRLTRFVVVDDGPWDCFLRLRVWAGCYDYGADGRALTGLGRALNCPHCASVYLVIFPSLLGMYSPWLLLWLAALGVVSLLYEVTK